MDLRNQYSPQPKGFGDENDQRKRMHSCCNAMIKHPDTYVCLNSHMCIIVLIIDINPIVISCI
jgi:hypothetical protein